MKDKSKARIAFAEAVTQALWLKGLITLKERDQMNQNTAKKLVKSNC